MRSVSLGVRLFRGRAAWLAAVVAVAFGSAAGRAQTFTWNQPTTGGDWQTSANWAPTTAPNAMSAVAVFGNVATGAHTVNLSAGVTLGELRFEDVNAHSTTAAYTIAAGQTITFDNNDAPALLTVGGFTRTNQTVAAALSVAGGDALTITNDGAPGLTTLTLGGALSATTAGTPLNVGGSSNTTISGAIGNNFGVLTKSGSGVLTLSGTNAYTGGTVINGGVVRVNTADGSSIVRSLGSTSSTVTLNGGALQFDVDAFIDQNFTIGANGGTIITTAGTGSSNPTIRGAISGTGNLTIDGGFYLDLTANNTYTGATVINNAGLRLTGGGRLSGTSSVVVNGYVGGQIGFLGLDNVGSSADRVSDSAAITLNGGLISGTAALIGAANETLSDLTVRGFGTLNAAQINGGIGTGSMLFNSISRADDFTTLYVGGPVFGPAGAGQNYQIKFASGITAPGGSGSQIGIIPWIGGDRGRVDTSGTAIVPTNFAETLYTYNATNGLIALDARDSINFSQVASLDPLIEDTHNALSGSPEALAGDFSVRSIVLNPDGSGTSTITGTGTLTVSTGAIANVRALRFNGPTLNFGTNTAFLYLGGDLTILGTSQITGANGVVVSSNSTNGRNTLILTNTTNPNTFSGGLYLNGSARVLFNAADTQLGAAGEKISFRGGTLRYNGSGAVTLATGGVNRPLEMFAAGGGMIAVENANGVLTVPGVVSGTEQLTTTGPGTLVLANAANTYQGGTTIGTGTLAIGGAGSLGAGDVTFGAVIGADTFAGGLLRFDFSGTMGAKFHLATGAATLDTNGNAVPLSGVVSGTGTTLTKAGAGTLTLSAANTYTGNTTVSAGTLLLTNTTGSGTGYGSVTVASGAAFGGTSTVNGSLAVNGTGKLIVGLPTGPGTLTLRGTTTLSSTSSFEARLAGATAGTGYSQLVVAAGGSIDLGGTTFLPTLTYTPSSTDTVFLIDNRNATGGLTGTFAGLAQGATVTFADGTTAVISYTGDLGSLSVGGGNDVVLHSFVPVPEPGAVLAIASLALGAVALRNRRKPAAAAAP